MSHPPLSPARRFRRDAAGSVSIVMALALLAVVGAVGAVLDFSRAANQRNALNAAADRAALAGAREAQVAEQNGATLTEVAARAKEVAQATFTLGLSPVPGYEPAVLEVTVKTEGKGEVQVHYKGDVRTTLAGVLGVSRVRVGGDSKAGFEISRPLEVHILLDTSASMQLGATQGDIDRLNSNTGCAFACHDGWRPAEWGYKDRFEWALANGVQLRFQAVNNGISNLLDHIRKQDPTATRVRVAVYGFNTHIQKYSDLTTDFAAVKNSLPRYMSGQTHLDFAIDQMVYYANFGDPAANAAADSSGRSNAKKTDKDEKKAEKADKKDDKGGGKAASTDVPARTAQAPRRLLLIATDGVNNSGYDWGQWWRDNEVRKRVDAMTGSKCRAFGPDVQIAVLHTPYLPLDWDQAYVQTLGAKSQKGGPGKREADVPLQLKECATAGLYIDAFDAAAIESAAVRLYQAAGAVRLTQ